MSSISSIFHSQGELSLVIPDYQARDEQITLAQAIDKTIVQKSILVAEAGTGTGKTFAYLVPAIKSGKKVIVSTGTKNLQDQLFYKDIPVIKEALISQCRVAILKGRANYLCEYRLDVFRQSREQLSGEQLQQLVKVVNWSIKTKSGDLGEISDIPEDSPLLPQITSTKDNCLGKNCAFIDSCYLAQARKKALQADLVIVNHHLFFADMALKDIGFGELIPQMDVVIFDEAHQVPEVACRYFGESTSTRQIIDLCHDISAIYKTEHHDLNQLYELAQSVITLAQNCRLSLPENNEKGSFNDLNRESGFAQAFAKLISGLNQIVAALSVIDTRSESIINVMERAEQILIKLNAMSNATNQNISLWYETTRKHLLLHQTPLSIADKFCDYMNKTKASWVFTSATLSVNNSVDHFTSGLGLANFESLLLDSPFDYQQQALLYVPRYLPEAFDNSRAQALAKMAIPLIEASQGNCFFLFTSYKMMYQVGEILQNQLTNPVFIQGEMAKGQVLEAYMSTDSAVLLATSSFWEGVDVKGQKLQCVIIDKLPFAAPNDPVLVAKSKKIKEQGGNAFTELQLPQAVISLKQGVGRLIRGASDKGVMVICDARITGKDYGEAFISSLPNMLRTREESKCLTFLKQLNHSN